jgi:MYXO-CTERM domain-containing protein
MKSKSLLLGLTLAAALSSSASAALVVEWDANNIPNGTTNPTAWDQDDHVTASTLDAHGTVHLFGNTAAVYTGFSATLDTNNYLGFTIQANPGYELNLTDLAYIFDTRGNSGGDHEWGYRIDNGSGYGNWIFASQTTANQTALLNWDFPDITTTGKVEFGFFAEVSDSSAEITPLAEVPGRDGLQLNGTVTPVPEASATLLGALGALAMLRRRR